MEGYHIMIHQSFQELISAEELMGITGITPGLLNYFLEWGLIEPVESQNGSIKEYAQLWFDISAVPKIRMIQRLRSDIGINLPGISIILNLQDRIQQLEQELKWYK
jgi:MerR family transcriptional regulator/heat shock protein HspR